VSRDRLGRRALTASLAALLLTLAIAPATASVTVRVRMRDDVFRPVTVTIERGDRVRWVNRGDRAHTTTGSTWDAVLDPGERFTKRFRRAGTYEYVCRFHPGMTGTIVVV
jgi:plastocyanin